MTFEDRHRVVVPLATGDGIHEGLLKSHSLGSRLSRYRPIWNFAEAFVCPIPFREACKVGALDLSSSHPLYPYTKAALADVVARGSFSPRIGVILSLGDEFENDIQILVSELLSLVKFDDQSNFIRSNR